MSIALISTPPDIVRPVFPTHLLNARANRVIESIRQKDIFAHFGQASTPLDNQLGNPNVAFNVLIKAARDDFAVDVSPHVGYFFRPFVNEQNH